MALGGAGCLVTDKPEFKEPEPTPPFLANFNPPTSSILVIPRKPGSTGPGNDYVQDVLISFDVHSEDLQRPLFGAVILDFPSREVICSFNAGTGTVGTARPISCKLEIRNSVTPACHSITAVFSHDTSIVVGQVGQSERDLGSASWWAQIGVDESIPDPLYKPCVPFPIPPDAGADARVEGGIR